MKFKKENEEYVQKNFWDKIKKNSSKIPFVNDVVAMYYCLLDKETPLPIKVSIITALAYFISPIDAIPDIMVGVGYADDAGVVATTLALIQAHVTTKHYKQAEEYLNGK